MSSVTEQPQTELMFNPPSRITQDSHIKSYDEYKRLHAKSIDDPVAFWSEICQQFHFERAPPLENFLSYNFDVNEGPITVKWMSGGRTNVCYNCLDRHIKKDVKFADKIAFHWEGNVPSDEKVITYGDLLKDVCKFANVLKDKGIKKGDCVALYMPMIFELVVAMLACARIGAVHSIVFGGYSSQSLATRLIDGKVKMLVTADAVWRGEKLIKLLEIAQDALEIASSDGLVVSSQIIVSHLNRVSNPKSTDFNHNGTNKETINNGTESGTLIDSTYKWNSDRDSFWADQMALVSDQAPVEWMESEDPLFILYTSGSTGVPKGVLHTTSGYMVYVATTFKYSFDIHPDSDVYWCTADIGWITGHSYVTYGPLLNGTTSVIFEGTPFYPSPERIWQIVEKYRVSKFYTAPTAVRSLMRYGESFVDKYDLSSLKVLGSVGEPINPEAWLWYSKYVGLNHTCSIVDTYWQTETGGHVLAPLPGCTPKKPGSACHPFFGVDAAIICRETGKVIEGECEGFLVLTKPWPGMMRTVYGNHERFEKTYFKTFPGYYMTGDGARRDKDGYIWITGRIDDMLNCSGHLLSTAEVESVLVTHTSVSEAAVVACSHPLKGQCIYAFVTLKAGAGGESYDEGIGKEWKSELRQLVRKQIASFASPDYIQESPQLPKTRSGKIMRRILRKIAEGDDNLGDISTMADPSILASMVEEYARLCKNHQDV